MQYYSTLKAKLIYIFTISDEAHRGLIKIGEATLDEATNLTLTPNSEELNAAARKRIDQYTKTAGIDYTLRYTELTVFIKNGQIQTFNDKEVHDVLIRSGIKRHAFDTPQKGREWFECKVETAVEAIKAVKEDQHSINPDKFDEIPDIIEFRPEQKQAIEKTTRKFKNGSKNMLWNAKMRFGKTLSALQVIKEMAFHRTIIVTHRPVVDEGWFEDFYKIFNWMRDPWVYGSREKGEPFENLEKAAKKDAKQHYVYFASIQDLRGAQEVGGKFNKNRNILAADYDLIIIDEAHEGTQTELGQNVLKKLQKEKTHILNLSGTPFNLLEDFSEDEIFTWDYVMEQKAKEEWDINHFGDTNPYAGLPRLNIFTFDLAKPLSGFQDIEDSAFNFKEFFRTWTGDIERDHREMPEGALGKFIHETDVNNFLDLIVKYDTESNYPFSTKEFRNSFRHSLWVVPGVKEARALSALLKGHQIFSQFDIVNVAGDGDEEVENDDALKLVSNAIGDDPEDTRTITLSCGKLTTGVTVRPWTAVMMLSGSHNTDAKTYMQTIFRVQSPYTTPDGRRKENCYVFDFAPDRTLKVLAEAVKIQTKSTASKSDRVKLGEFLNFCPVIGYNGTKMASYNVDRMLEQLKRAYITRVTKNGCDDPRLYNQEMLRKLDAEALAKFKNLHAIIGATKANHTSTDVDMNKTGLTNEQYAELEHSKKKKKTELTKEDKKRIEEAKEKKKNADSAISILRGISIRLPLLMYGAELTNEGQDITLENLVDLIDNQSWEEFMPRGVTKELFKEFTPYYDPDMFRAVSRNYRDLVRAADRLAPMERTREVAKIFSYFRNPDKETVLTPWRVVNMHIGDCIGGQVFFEPDMQTEASVPIFKDQGEVTKRVFKDPKTRILEINSKTGLYPLYMAYSVFAEKLQEYRDTHMLATDVPIPTQNEIWDEVLQNHIFIICKTEMAKSITKRTLRGFRSAKVNARHFEDLVNKITNQPDLFLNKVTNGIGYWENNNLEENMKFNAVVGNPPYQKEGDSTRKQPIYNYFYDISFKLSSIVSLITPARFLFRAGQTPKPWMEKMLADPHFRVVKHYQKSTDVFPSVDIKGGVAITLRDADTTLGPIGFFSEYEDLKTILQKVLESKDFTKGEFSSLISSRGMYRFTDSFFRDYPEAKDALNKGTGNMITSNSFEQYESIFYEEKPEDGNSYIELFGRFNNQRVYRWIRRSYIEDNDYLNKYNVLVPEANGTGAIGEVLSTPVIGTPVIGHTDTFLSIGKFDTEYEAEACLKYITSKFCRTMLGTLKATQHNPRDTWDNVPMQDFSATSDIDWSEKTESIDAQLYKKYHLNKDEIGFIESHVTPMNNDALFDTDSLIDPEFANFDLIEYGVKIGDRITYTPTDTELIVVEGNKVAIEGETFTLAEFTAKYMPHNKRSISGICQGPKYFSYKGTSLYKLKKSFPKE